MKLKHDGHQATLSENTSHDLETAGATPMTVNLQYINPLPTLIGESLSGFSGP